MRVMSKTQLLPVLILLMWIDTSPVFAQPVKTTQTVTKGVVASERVQQAPPSSKAKLPPARRVFSADLDQDGSDELLIAHNTSLMAWRWLGQEKRWSELWRTEGPGVAQKIEKHPTKGVLYVAWGMGKGKMVAPITVSRIDSLSGQQMSVWSYKGKRSQVVALQLFQADKDSDLELLIAHFVSKYHSRRVVLDNLNADQPQEHLSGQLRMATSWLIADIDGVPGLEEVIGRVYGEERGEYGDLSVQSFKLDAPQLSLGEIIPSARGVKGVFTRTRARSMNDQAGQTREELLFSDGWVAAYGKRARAGLKRLSWQQGRANVESLCVSSGEFTFFELWARRDPKTSRELLFTQGNKGVNLITPKASGAWTVSQLLATPPIVNVAIAFAGGQWWAFTPSESGALAHKLKIPNL